MTSERIPVAHLARQFGLTDAAVRYRMSHLDIYSRGGVTPEEAQRLAEHLSRGENNAVRTRPGSKCTCGAALAPGQKKWFCSDRCRSGAIEACCETLAGLLASGMLSRKAKAA